MKLIRGIGPQNEARLNAIDVHTFKQIAKWSKKDQANIGYRLAFPGRIEREDWVGQARLLAKGKSTEFSERVSNGEVESSLGVGENVSLGQAPASKKRPGSGGDDLTLINGVGEAIAQKLNDMGTFKYKQIAKWSSANQDWIGYQLGFPGRPQREDWVKQARKLAKG